MAETAETSPPAETNPRVLRLAELIREKAATIWTYQNADLHKLVREWIAEIDPLDPCQCHECVRWALVKELQQKFEAIFR